MCLAQFWAVHKFLKLGLFLLKISFLLYFACIIVMDKKTVQNESKLDDILKKMMWDLAYVTMWSPSSVWVTYETSFSFVSTPMCNTQYASCSSDLVELLFLLGDISYITSRLNHITSASALRRFLLTLHPQLDYIIFQRSSSSKLCAYPSITFHYDKILQSHLGNRGKETENQS